MLRVHNTFAVEQFISLHSSTRVGKHTLNRIVFVCRQQIQIRVSCASAVMDVKTIDWHMFNVMCIAYVRRISNNIRHLQLLRTHYDQIEYDFRSFVSRGNGNRGTNVTRKFCILTSTKTKTKRVMNGERCGEYTHSHTHNTPRRRKVHAEESEHIARCCFNALHSVRRSQLKMCRNLT